MSSALATIVLDLFVGTFAARLDRYVLDSRETVIEPLTPKVMEWAFKEDHSVSTFLCADNVTNVGAIDLDEGGIRDGIDLRRMLDTHGIPSILCESRRGIHLWTFHEGDGSHDTMRGAQVPCGVVRKALRASCGLVGLPTHDPKVSSAKPDRCSTCGESPQRHPEIFPKPQEAGGALRLPLMVHPKDGRTYPVYDMDGTYITKVADLVNATAELTSPYTKVHALSGVGTGPVEYPRMLGVYRKPVLDDSLTPTVSELLDAMGVTSRPGHTIRCPFHDDSHASLSIASDDRRVWCKSPRCPIHNGGRGMGSLALRSYLMKARPP